MKYAILFYLTIVFVIPFSICFIYEIFSYYKYDNPWGPAFFIPIIGSLLSIPVMGFTAQIIEENRRKK